MTRKYKNPILSGFYPDPSICRVGNDFYLVNSTFAYFPGIPVFHSVDLINWRQIGNAIDRPGQLNYDEHQISQGLFAPSIRYNNGTFYILCTLIKNGGNFIITAKNPAGPWSDPVWLEGAGGIDPSIFFDENGRVWYCGTQGLPDGRYYGDNEIYIREMNIALLDENKNPLIGENICIWHTALLDAVWSEGPHIYKKDGWYYLLYAEGGTGLDHAVCIARAKNILGPWEGKKSNPVLTHRHLGKKSDVINVGHADIIDDTEGNWWMVLLASRPFDGVCPLGRETFMVPIYWEEDWPFVITKTGLIESEYSFLITNEELVMCNEFKYESACDHFNGKLPLHWLVLRMPVNLKDAAFSLTERNSALRLFTREAGLRGRDHPAFAGRRIRDKNWVFSALLEFNPKADGESAGIVLLQSEDWHYRLEIFRTLSDNISLRLIKAGGAQDEIIISSDLPVSGSSFVLAASCEDMKLSFFYGKDQYSLVNFTNNIDARILSTEYAGGFVGTLAGVFASGNGKNIDNYADVLWAEYRGL
ncbi:MAG: glycoside hydrolase family 43 protein [Treponema sp.]|nr:glycoside hydrolase family 43 protein [Treponema sp.]